MNKEFINQLLELDVLKLIEKDPCIIKLIDPDCMTITEVMSAVSFNGMTLRYVPKKYRNRDVIAIALKSQPFAIKYIENQEEWMQLISVESQPHSIRVCKDPNYRVLKKAFSLDGRTLKYFKYKIDNSLLLTAAIVSYPDAIRNIKNPSWTLLNLAISLDPNCIRLIDADLDYDLQYAVCISDSSAYRWIKNPDERISNRMKKFNVSHTSNSRTVVKTMYIFKDIEGVNHCSLNSYTNLSIDGMLYVLENIYKTGFDKYKREFINILKENYPR